MDDTHVDTSVAAPAPHLVGLADGWRLWRTVCLRGAGFPVALLERIAAPEAVQAVEALFACEAQEGAAREQAVQACMGGRDSAKEAAGKVWSRAAKRIAKGGLPEPSAETADLAPLIERLARAQEETAAARRAAEVATGSAQERISAALRETVSDPRFREALMWQNRRALHGSLDVLLRADRGSRKHSLRRHERLALSYLQRYAAKNESIGFFGPIGWGTCTDDGPAIVARPGPNLVSDRFVHFEYWAVEELAAVLAREPSLRPWLAPRLNPLVRIEGGAICDAAGRRHTLPAPIGRLLAACDGNTTGQDIAARLVGDSAFGFTSAQQVFAALARLAQRGVLYWRLEVPIAPYPERALAGMLNRIGDTELRVRLSAPLEELVAARARVAAAAGHADALDTALDDLEARFVRLTGAAVTRHHGAIHGGRTLIYEDCRRDVALTLGPEPISRLGPPLALVLASARWFTHTAARRVTAGIEKLLNELQRKTGTDRVDFAPLSRQIFRAGLFSDAYHAVVVRELHSRWAQILAFDKAQRRLNLASAALRARVAAAFPAPDPGFPSARHHSPDVLIAARSVDAIRRGQYQLVLGEVHAGLNTQMQAFTLLLHPRPEALVAAREHDIPVPHLLPVNHPRDRRGQRYAPHSLAVGDFEIAWNDAAPSRPREQVLAVSNLVAERTGAGIAVCTRDGTKSFDILDVFNFQLRSWSSRNFGLLPSALHTPRIAIDDVVINRETWRFPCHALSFAKEHREFDRFVAARRWARAHELPRRVFVRFPHERKPVYADLESPACVELLAHMARGAVRQHEDGFVSVVEMLPEPEDTWLTDADGNRYTSELRLVAVDSLSWPSGCAAS
jgi:hypothetical protein